MRLVRCLFLLVIIPALSFAADLKVRVLDPQSAAVASARVSLLDANGRVIRVTSVAPNGTAAFSSLEAGNYRVRVLAPGFAETVAPVRVAGEQSVDVKLKIAGALESVVVTAAASPVPVDESGTTVSALDAATLNTLNPTTLDDALRLIPGALVEGTGRRGSLSTLFVRGGESRYNKVIIDNVPVNDPGGIFDFGVLSANQLERVEVLRGAASSLYGSDAMTSVVQLWSAPGTTTVPEVRFGAEGGTFSTARGYASIAGARGIFDYNLFGEQFATNGQGVNDDFSNALQGGNIGIRLAQNASLRFRVRHTNSRTGVPGNWWFNGSAPVSPDSDAYARQNNLIASSELTIVAPHNWIHRLTGFEYSHDRANVDSFIDPGRGEMLDSPFASSVKLNRAGLQYTSEFSPRQWTRTVFGYYFEDEHERLDSSWISFFGGMGFPGESHTPGPGQKALRLNHALFGEQFVDWKRFSLLAGIRYENNDSFGEKVLPRATVTFLALRGGQVFSGTRLRASYAEGIEEPSFEAVYGVTGTYLTLPNPTLRPERTRAMEAGFQQSLFGGRFALNATYFNNRFTDQIQYKYLPAAFASQYINLNRALAHGAELELSGRLSRHLTLNGAYVYDSTQALLAPSCTSSGSGCSQAGEPLQRRPKHFGNLLLSYSGTRWGGSLGGTFVGRRPDSDFFTAPVPVNYAAGYARADVSTWYAINRHVTAYANVGNFLNHRYNEVVGYPALKANFRAGMRFRFGGE